MKKLLTRISFILVLLLINFMTYAKQEILVYAGPGAGPNSLANTVAMLQEFVGNKYVVKTITPEEVIAGKWMHKTALFIMPGGADRPYLEKLQGQGNLNIKKYVQNGGKYLGICAGAYYAADRIEFAKGDAALEVIGDRELKFYPGLVEGPTYKGFDHRDVQNTAGMRAATIHMQSKSLAIFYNGGGHFVDADNFANVKVLARYGDEAPYRLDKPAAIIECNVGRGKAILSGPHFEWDAKALNKISADLTYMQSKLATQEESRQELIRYIFNRLELYS